MFYIKSKILHKHCMSNLKHEETPVKASPDIKCEVPVIWKPVLCTTYAIHLILEGKNSVSLDVQAFSQKGANNSELDCYFSKC